MVVLGPFHSNLGSGTWLTRIDLLHFRDSAAPHMWKCHFGILYAEHREQAISICAIVPLPGLVIGSVSSAWNMGKAYPSLGGGSQCLPDEGSDSSDRCRYGRIWYVLFGKTVSQDVIRLTQQFYFWDSKGSILS